MGNILYLAWRYLKYYKGRSCILVFCLTFAMALPITVHRLVGALQTDMLQRADETPLVVGPKGSRFDLALHALYFEAEAPGIMTQSERFAIEDSGYAFSIPLFVMYQARGFPIVGTTLDYFTFRDIGVERGRMMTLIGDCVVGWEVAQRLGLSPGDRLLSDPENVFDLGGVYPLNMRVTGVLERNRTADDMAVFVDVKTSWIIEGIGHGHEEFYDDTDPALILEEDDDLVVASPQLETYTEITPDNIHTFHFHGDPRDFPLTAVIAVPEDDRSATLLLGRYVDGAGAYQALRPSRVIGELMGMIVQLRRFFDVQHIVMLGVTSCFVFLVMLLSTRLRSREVETMYHLGCSRGTIIRLLAAELCLVLVASVSLAFLLSSIVMSAVVWWVPMVF